MSKIKEQEDIFDFDITCPVCNKKFESYKDLRSHISKSKKEHLVLKEVLANDKLKSFKNYAEFTEQFNSVKDLYDEKIDEYKKVHKIKSEEEKELNRNAHFLVSNFYNYTQSKSTNWARDLNMIKSHLKADMTQDEIKVVFRHLIKKGEKDLRFFNAQINEALTIEKCRKEFKKSGTDANLVYEFYKKTNQKLTDRSMFQGIKKITELKNEGYSIEEIMAAIEYMVSINEKCFNFIPNKIEEALAKKKDTNNMTKQYDNCCQLINDIINERILYGTVLFDNNILKKEVIMNLKNDLINGKVDLRKLSSSYKVIGNKLAEEILERKIYSNRFTRNEWVRLVNL